MEIKLLCSQCATNDYYLEDLQTIINKLMVKATISKIDDPEELKKYNISIRCLFGYCPGCNAPLDKNDTSKYVPALIINDQVKLHSCFPMEDKLKEIIEEELKHEIKIPKITSWVFLISLYLFFSPISCLLNCPLSIINC